MSTYEVCIMHSRISNILNLVVVPIHIGKHNPYTSTINVFNFIFEEILTTFPHSSPSTQNGQDIINDLVLICTQKTRGKIVKISKK